MPVLSHAFSGRTPDESRKMEVDAKRRHAVMAAALVDAEDDKLLSAKRKMILARVDATQRTRNQEPIV